MNNFLSLTNFYNLIKLITSNQIKFVRSLHLKKNRDVHNCFIVEGEKIVDEILRSDFNVHSIFATKDCKSVVIENSKTHLVSDKELERVSALKSPNKVIAIVEKRDNNFKFLSVEKGLTLVLDNIKNPGNLGTIIRVCDWFGIKNIICSNSSVDMYNPKVVQATMGSFLRVDLYYTDIETLIKRLPNNFPIYGSYMEGANVADVNLKEDAFLIMGNESVGISKKLEKLISNKISVRKYNSQAESLNVANATSIFLYEFKR